jgi:hypothetical protein
MLEQITALHEQVREYVEQLEPGYKVTTVDGYTTSDYMLPLGKYREIDPNKVEYVHALTVVSFTVSAEYVPDRHRKLRVDVWVTSDGKLYTGDRLMSI